jgi:hypothetical protein
MIVTGRSACCEICRCFRSLSDHRSTSRALLYLIKSLLPSSFIETGFEARVLCSFRYVFVFATRARRPKK